jgi:adenine deaminase
MVFFTPYRHGGNLLMTREGIVKGETRILTEVALGRAAPDVVIRNGTLFNAFTGEFIPGQSIWIKGEKIAYVGREPNPPVEGDTEILDAGKMVLLPGLIDGHTHVVFRSCIEELIKHVIPGGTTTIITETIELATVAGIDGMHYLVQGLRDQPLRFYFTVAPLCGLTPSQETRAPSNEQFLTLLKDPDCLGVGEIYWGNMFLDTAQGERVRELASLALDLNKRVEGHSAGATGRKLQAYAGFGVSSCHEPIDEEQVLERLRLGYWVMVRQGSIRKELDGIEAVFKKDLDLRRLVLATDGVDPEGLLEDGYLDAAVRRALELGVRPAQTYQMVTLNVAEHFRLDHLLGSLSPGKMADLVIIPAPDDFSPQLVMSGGNIIYKDGERTVAPREVRFPDSMFHTVEVSDHDFPPPPQKGTVRVMELVNRLVTQERRVDLEDPEESADVIMCLALDRLGGGGAFTGLLKGFELQRGACGTTMSWDTGDMIVVGCDPRSMKTAVERLRVLGGGGVFAIADQIVSEFPAPLCGVTSLSPMEQVADEVRRLERSLRDHGVRWEKPLLTIDTLGSAAIPHLRITHNGYVKLKDRRVLPLEVARD